MTDKFDYAEPSCPLCDGKDFYYPDKDKPLGTIPVPRIINKVDELFGRNDYAEAGRLLEYWRSEAAALRDRCGELAIESELVGYYRKQGDAERGLASARRALELTDALEQGNMASGATVFINCATAYKAFGMPEEAMLLYRRAEEIYKSTLPEGDARFGGLYNNMALALADLGRANEAEAAYLSALSVMENVDGGEPECAITYINMAHMYDDLGAADKTDGCMKKALALLESEAVPRDGYYAFVIEKCAPSFGYFGDPETAARLMKEAKDIYERS